MKSKILGIAGGILALASVAVAADCPYTVVPYTFSVAMWGNGVSERNLIPQEPIFGTDSAGNITTAASLEQCNAVRAVIIDRMRTLNTCKRCAYQWLSSKRPQTCAKCRSRVWDVARTQPERIENASYAHKNCAASDLAQPKSRHLT